MPGGRILAGTILQPPGRANSTTAGCLFRDHLWWSASFFLSLPRELRVVGKAMGSVATLSSNYYFLKHTKTTTGSKARCSRSRSCIFGRLRSRSSITFCFPVLLMAFFSWTFNKRVPVAQSVSVGQPAPVDRVVQVEKRLLMFHAATALASLIFSSYVLAHDPSAAFYGLFSRAWELLVGGTLAIALPRLEAKFSSVQQALAADIGMIAVVFSIVGYSHATVFPGIAALLPCLGAAMVIFGGSPPGSSGLAWVPSHSPNHSRFTISAAR